MRVTWHRTFTRGQEHGNTNTQKTTAHPPLHPLPQTSPKCQQAMKPRRRVPRGCRVKASNASKEVKTADCKKIQEFGKQDCWQQRATTHRRWPEFFRMSRETKASSFNAGAISESSRMADVPSSASSAIIAARKAAKVAAWQGSPFLALNVSRRTCVMFLKKTSQTQDNIFKRMYQPSHRVFMRLTKPPKPLTLHRDLKQHGERMQMVEACVNDAPWTQCR